MTKNRNNIPTPLKAIEKKLRELETHPLRAFKTLTWLRENMEGLKAWQKRIDKVTEHRHQQEMDSILLSEGPKKATERLSPENGPDTPQSIKG